VPHPTLAIRAHAALAEARAGRHGFATWHVEHLADADPPRSAAAAADLLTRVATTLGEAGATGALRLAVPLGHADRLDTTVPSTVPWPPVGIEPPSFYYLEPRFLLLPDDREEYRCPHAGAEIEGAGLLAVYACGRDPLSRARGWGYTRTLWLTLAAEPPSTGMSA
jgi:hypothetical protein